MDLSAPEEASVNSGISRDFCSLHYASIDDAIKFVRELGPGSLPAKLDLKKAYRMVPVHPDDQWLLGVCWEERIYLDTALPFGPRSAPKIFTAMADGLVWLLRQNGVEWFIHCLDDFVFWPTK